MREMHKWKDKVELSLDNRQIFFLFFGLSVVGCFVFALGVMTGRRVDWDAQAEVAAMTDNSLDLLAAEIAGGSDEFAFKSGLRESTAPQLASTRDPSIAPRDAKELAAIAEAEAQGKTVVAEATPVKPAGDDKKTRRAVPSKPAAAAAPAKGKASADKKGAGKAKPVSKAPASKANAEVLASGNKSAAEQKAAKAANGTRRFTLQMKAFSQQADAEKFAANLRRNGHDIRVEEHEVRGRKWHRVRLGTFTNWDEALAAKNDFETSEHVIAYVVSE